MLHARLLIQDKFITDEVVTRGERTEIRQRDVWQYQLEHVRIEDVLRLIGPHRKQRKLYIKNQQLIFLEYNMMKIGLENITHIGQNEVIMVIGIERIIYTVNVL